MGDSEGHLSPKREDFSGMRASSKPFLSHLAKSNSFQEPKGEPRAEGPQAAKV